MIAGRDKNPYAACFDEIDAAVTALHGSDPPVVFNFHNYPDDVPKDAILYNFDNVGIHFKPDLLFSRFSSHIASGRLWDFSLQNVRKLLVHGIGAKHVPVGYHSSMECFSPVPYTQREIDVVFAGAINERRAKVLDGLRNKGLHVFHVPDLVYGRQRDAIFARSKLALSMMFYEDGAFPALRVAHLAANKVPLLSEERPDDWGFVFRCPYSDLVDRAEFFLRHRPPEFLPDLAELTYYHFKKNPLFLPTKE